MAAAAAATKKESRTSKLLQLCPAGKMPKGKNNNSLSWIYSGQRSEDDDGEKREDVVAHIKTMYNRNDQKGGKKKRIPWRRQPER